jgi:hypothetical protein
VTRYLLASALALVPLAASAGEPELDAIRKLAAPLRPTKADLAYRDIPWLTDAADALKQAKAENRPLFVWLAGGRKQDGTPLERC